MSTILKAENINKTFVKSKEQSLHILKDVSLEIETQKITEIVGASGAGKSTLLHILSGLDKPDSGKVAVKNTDIFSLTDEKLAKFRNEHIGFVFQFHHLLPEFTAAENIALARMINNESLSKATSKAKDLLDIVGLSERVDHKPAELSGGEQQRVAVARALANEPEIIFADEPTGNLDSANSEILHNLFRKLKSEMGITFLMVTHNPELIKLADKVYEMKDGRLNDHRPQID
jgi:lipoprotein-releasing system ATP-binding protein